VALGTKKQAALYFGGLQKFSHAYSLGGASLVMLYGRPLDLIVESPMYSPRMPSEINCTPPKEQHRRQRRGLALE